MAIDYSFENFSKGMYIIPMYGHNTIRPKKKINTYPPLYYLPCVPARPRGDMFFLIRKIKLYFTRFSIFCIGGVKREYEKNIIK